MASLSPTTAFVPAPLAAWLAGRRAFEPMAVPVYGALALAAAVVGLAIVSGRFGFDRQLFADGASAIGFFLMLAYAVRVTGFARLATGLEMAMLTVAMPIILGFASLVLASSALPFRDADLAALDARLFAFDRTAVVALAMRSPGVMKVAEWIYDSLAVTPQLLLVVLIATGRLRTAWLVLTALVVTAVIAIAIMPLVPALGTPPYAYKFAEVFHAVRAGELRHLDGASLTGLVTFPSVHAADGVILAWGFAKLGRWALPLVVLNVLMVGSALLIGGHYLIDLIAGVALAFGGIKLAERLVGRFDRGNSRSPD